MALVRGMPYASGTKMGVSLIPCRMLKESGIF